MFLGDLYGDCSLCVCACMGFQRGIVIHCNLLNMFCVSFCTLPLNACTLQLGHS